MWLSGSVSKTAGLSLEEVATLFDDNFGIRKSQQFRRAKKDIRQQLV